MPTFKQLAAIFVVGLSAVATLLSASAVASADNLWAFPNVQ
tara:strand:+ start:460 stop:582 length:123 start_codon:yes stop_codon:yes gene_type:complete